MKQWFNKGVADKQHYMLVYCDTFDYGDYPVYAKDAKEFWEKLESESLSEHNMQRLMEVYDLTLDRDNQLDEERANHRPE